jgi:hypothetical protein
MKIRGAIALWIVILILEHMTPTLFSAGEESGVTLFHTVTHILHGVETANLAGANMAPLPILR